MSVMTGVYIGQTGELNGKILSLAVRVIWGRGGTVGRGTALLARKSRVLFPIASFRFSIDLILTASLWVW
jgi:hypothetical protein